MNYQAKREVVQAIQVEVPCTLEFGGTKLKAKKGNWLIFANGKPVEALTNAEFGKRYEPVSPIGVPDWLRDMRPPFDFNKQPDLPTWADNGTGSPPPEYLRGATRIATTGYMQRLA